MMNRIRIFLSGSIAACALLVTTATTAATQIAPVGSTFVVLTATPVLVGAGVGVDKIGTAALFPDASGNLIGAFAITGGTLDPDLGNALVEHEGSGLALSRNGTTVNLENFLIDTTLPTDTIFGKVSVGSTTLENVPLFTLSGANLFLSETAGDALVSFLAIPDLGGAQLGFALTNPLPVPEPETYAMMGAGLVLLAFARSGRRQKVAVQA